MQRSSCNGWHAFKQHTLRSPGGWKEHRTFSAFTVNETSPKQSLIIPHCRLTFFKPGRHPEHKVGKILPYLEHHIVTTSLARYLLFIALTVDLCFKNILKLLFLCCISVFFLSLADIPTHPRPWWASFPPTRPWCGVGRAVPPQTGLCECVPLPR